MNLSSSEDEEADVAKSLSYFPEAVVTSLKQQAFNNRHGNEGRKIIEKEYVSVSETYSFWIAVPLESVQTVNELMAKCQFATIFHIINGKNIGSYDF
jgi:hypothetical protein